MDPGDSTVVGPLSVRAADRQRRLSGLGPLRSGALRVRARYARQASRRCQRGIEVVEFALIVPIFLALLFGIMQVAFLLNNYLMVTAASAAGARILASARSPATYTCPSALYPCPVTDAANAVKTGPWTSFLTLTDSMIKLELVNGGTTTTCKTYAQSVSASLDATCKAALVSGGLAVVTVTYPPHLLLNISLFSSMHLASNWVVASKEIVQ